MKKVPALLAARALLHTQTLPTSNSILRSTTSTLAGTRSLSRSTSYYACIAALLSVTLLVFSTQYNILDACTAWRPLLLLQYQTPIQLCNHHLTRCVRHLSELTASPVQDCLISESRSPAPSPLLAVPAGLQFWSWKHPQLPLRFNLSPIVATNLTTTRASHPRTTQRRADR